MCDELSVLFASAALLLAGEHDAASELLVGCDPVDVVSAAVGVAVGFVEHALILPGVDASSTAGLLWDAAIAYEWGDDDSALELIGRAVATDDVMVAAAQLFASVFTEAATARLVDPVGYARQACLAAAQP